MTRMDIDDHCGDKQWITRYDCFCLFLIYLTIFKANSNYNFSLFQVKIRKVKVSLPKSTTGFPTFLLPVLWLRTTASRETPTDEEASCLWGWSTWVKGCCLLLAFATHPPLSLYTKGVGSLAETRRSQGELSVSLQAWDAKIPCREEPYVSQRWPEIPEKEDPL